MGKKRIGCRSCSHYSASLGRCKMGMINPTTIKSAKSVAQIMGVSYICNVNGMRNNITNDGIRTWQKENGI
jgi:hypothetical protein